MREIALTFKEGLNKDEYLYLHPRTKEGVELLAVMLSHMGLVPEITSILRPPGSIAGESGVHATLRACDVVGRGNVDHKQMQVLADALNVIFARADRYPFCLYHDGTGWHFHIQAMKTPGWIDAKGYLDEHVKLLNQMK